MKKRENMLDFDYQEHTFRVTVGADGEFWTEWEGDSIHAVSYALLKKKVMIVVQPVTRCAIEAHAGRHTADLKRVVLIGFHASNGNMLYRVVEDEEGNAPKRSDEGTHQFYRNDTDLYPVLSPAQRAEWAKLEDDERAAAERIRAWKKQHRMDANATMRKALKLPPLSEAEKKRRWSDDDD